MNKIRDKIKDKLNKFLLFQSKKYLLSLEEYNMLEPYEKGFVSYLQSSWVESEIPEDQNPFEAGTTEYEDFCKGSFHAMQTVQEMED